MDEFLLNGASNLLSVGDPGSALADLCEALAARLPVDRLEVFYRDPRQGRLESRAVRHGSREVVARSYPSATGLVPAAPEARVVSDLSTLADGPELIAEQLQSAALAPIAPRSARRGILRVVSGKPNAFTPEDLPLLRNVAHLVGTALAAEDQRSLLTAQGRIAEILAGASDLDPIFGGVAEGFREILPWDSLLVFSPPDERGMAEALAVAGGPLGSIAPGMRVRPGEALLEAGLRTVLPLPLHFQGELQGTLFLAAREADAYLPEDTTRASGLLSLLAAHLNVRRTVRHLELSEARYRALCDEMATRQDQLVHAEKLASVGQLAAGVAHEINNPAAVVMSSLSHLSHGLLEMRAMLGEYRRSLRGADRALADQLHEREVEAKLPEMEAEIEEVISESQSAMRRIRDVVRGLVRFAYSPAVPPGLLDLREVAERAITVVQNEVRHRARLVRDYQAVPAVSGDPGELELVMVNLLLNAAQAIPEGAADSHEIRVGIYPEQGRVVVEVQDDGVGIPPEILPRIFDPFFTTKPIGQGTGLGLSQVHGVLRKHGGDIALESTPGRGTLARARIPAARPPEEAHPAAAPAEAAPEMVASRRPRVMVVDDEPLVLRAAERALRRHCDVACVASGGEALRLLASDPPPDFILCDLMMPEMTGMDLYDHISWRFPALERRIFFATGGPFTPRARAFAEKMGSRVLDKPFSGPDLVALIAKHVGKAR